MRQSVCKSQQDFEKLVRNAIVQVASVNEFRLSCS